MKRFISTAIMTLLMCVCIFSSASAAGSDLTYDLTVKGSNSVTAKTGDIITVTYTIHSDKDYSVAAIQNEIKYDESFFELVDGSVSANVGTGKFINKIAGPRVYMNSVMADYDAEQVVGTFQLKVIAKSGSGKVESTEALAYDSEGQEMDIALDDLTVKIGNSSSGGGSSSGGSTVTRPTETGIEVNVKESDGAYDISFTDKSDNSTIKSLSEPVVVTVPASSGNVAAIVSSDGSYTVIPKSIVKNNKAYFLLDRPATVKIIDNSKSFADVADSAWYKDAVDFASSHELFNGVTDTEFAPSQVMNRAMLVTVLYRLDSTPSVRSAQLFSDVAPGSWYSNAVTWGSDNKIVEGYGNGLFGPGDKVTREQMAVFLYRYMKHNGMDVSAAGSLDGYSDAGSVSSWATEAMQWAVGSGIISGKGSGVLDPTGTATRAEVATMLMRVVELMLK